MNFISFCGRKNSKIGNNLHFTKSQKSEIFYILQSLYPPSLNLQVILLKFKMDTTSRLFKYLWPQKL